MQVAHGTLLGPCPRGILIKARLNTSESGFRTHTCRHMSNIHYHNETY
jgi:hypothetical protein